MKLVNYRRTGRENRLGFLFNDYVYDIKKMCEYLTGKSSIADSIEMLEVLNIDAEPFQKILESYSMLPATTDDIKKLLQREICYSLKDVSILLPFTPLAIICSGNNYRDHLQEKTIKDSRDLKGEDIEFFPKLPQCIIGPYDPIIYPAKLTEKLDYEIELAVVIGREAWQANLAEAFNCIFGYSVFNDVSARDRQMTVEKCMKAGLSKNFECCGSLGPCVVTSNEFLEPIQMEMVTKVNGEARQHSNTKYMINNPAFLISYFSQFFKLKPCYMLATGTIGGTAWSTDAELGGIPYERTDIVRGGYLRPGDTVTCWIEGIGELRNPIIP